MADQKKVDAMMAGDLAATAEWRQITEGLSAQPPAPTGPREAERAYLDEIGGYNVPQDVLDEFQRGDPVTPRERHYAEQKFASSKTRISIRAGSAGDSSHSVRSLDIDPLAASERYQTPNITPRKEAM